MITMMTFRLWTLGATIGFLLVAIFFEREAVGQRNSAMEIYNRTAQAQKRVTLAAEDLMREHERLMEADEKLKRADSELLLAYNRLKKACRVP